MRQISMFRKFATAMVVCTIVIAGVTTTATAEQNQPQALFGFQSIVGSWKLVEVQQGTIFFGTYNGGPFRGTVNFSSPFEQNSLTHGVWKRTGPRTFADTDSAFIYENGIAAGIVTFRAEIELSADGESGTFNFESEEERFDGQPGQFFASTAIGTRIKVEPLGSL